MEIANPVAIAITAHSEYQKHTTRTKQIRKKKMISQTLARILKDLIAAVAELTGELKSFRHHRKGRKETEIKGQRLGDENRTKAAKNARHLADGTPIAYVVSPLSKRAASQNSNAPKKRQNKTPENGMPVAFVGPQTSKRTSAYIKQLVAGQNPTPRARQMYERKIYQLKEWQQSQFEKEKKQRKGNSNK